MNKKVRNTLLVFTAIIMMVVSMTIGNGKANEVNKREALPTNAAGVSDGTFIYKGDGSELGSDDDVIYDSEITEAETFAVEEVPEIEEKSEAEKKLESMTLEQKVAQMFFLTPEALTGQTNVIFAGDVTKASIEETPIGGVIYMGDNLQSYSQAKEMLANTNNYSKEIIGLPMFLGVDEEGGTVARIAGSGRFTATNVGNMRDIGANGSVESAKQAGETMGTYLSDIGFNLDFAPVADVLTNPDNEIVKVRSFGSDSDVVSDMSLAVAEGLESKGVVATYKHFPGHGATAGDTHLGAAFTNRTLSEIKTCELEPFQNAIDNGAKFIMVSHISTPNITGHDTPASLSKEVITDLLRDEMGYNGIVISDSMYMGAISSKYTSDEAAILAVEAGVDILLMPQDFKTAYQGLIDAVDSGRISEERIDESVLRIIEVKLAMN